MHHESCIALNRRGIMDRLTLAGLLAVAKGKRAPDVVIINSKIINVFTNEIEEDMSVGIKNGRIVTVHNGPYQNRYPSETEIIDAGGRYLCPGFIDAHTHLDGIYPFHELVPYAIRGGTTTIVTECAMAANACGIRGVQSLIESTKGYPLRAYFLAPPLTPPFPDMEESLGVTYREFARLLKQPDFLGIGEGYWTRVAEGDRRVLRQAALALSLRKTIEGHSAGARKDKLVQYLLTGITSCHESITVDEAMEKLRHGLYVMIREGFVRRELKELSKLKNKDIDRRRLMLVSDVFDAVMLCDEGYLDTIVKKAIECGFSPMEAIKMVTINPADYFGLRFLGAIAPLRYADILFLKSPEDILIDKVMVNGEIVFSEGMFQKGIRPHAYPEEMKHTLSVGKVGEDTFRIEAKGPFDSVRVIELTNETITKETTFTPSVREGFLEKDVRSDILPVAVINRRKNQVGKGFVKGTGITGGAVATTFIWDTCNILVIGSDEHDMKDAVNRLIDIQGGIVVARGGRIIYEFPMPVYGLIPTDSMQAIRDKTLALDEAMKAIGTRMSKPFLTIQTIAFTGLPFLRITDKGLVDIRSKKPVSLFINR
jgi:adenine deaminase